MRNKFHKLNFFLMVCSIICTMTITCASAWPEDVVWHPYEEGLALGKKDNKKIFVHFHARSCKYCARMKKETFKDPAVLAYLAENFVCIDLEFQEKKELFLEYGVQKVPDNWFLTAGGQKISNLPGFVPPDEFFKMLEYIHREIYKKMSFKKFMNQQ
jgi:thioredoxin-related protein